MDENDSTRGYQFHRNEAISAVVDEGFLAEEEDDYEDLYNDVNVGENFHHSLRKNEDDSSKIGQGKEEHEMPSNKADAAKPEVVEDVNVNSHQEEVVDRVEGFQNVNDADVGRGMTTPSSVGGGSGFRVELNKVGNLGDRNAGSTVPSNQQVVQHQQYQQNQHPAVPADVGNVYGGSSSGSGGSGGGGTILYVGDLHWWTTDADLESELCKYGPVKELKFFDERASGKSKGYCQVEFYDPAAAMACKERMNGHLFNERPCVVAHASPYNIRKMGEAQVNRNQQQMGQGSVNQPRRGPGDLPGRPGGVVGGMPTGGINQGGMESNGRGFGRGNWGRGGAVGGMGIRGQSGPMRNRGGGAMGPRGNGFGQAMGGVPPLMPPQSMMGQGFDPAFGGPMGRMGGYGGFPGAPAAPFPGLLSSFGPVGNVGLPGVAPHVNPAFFGRGMPMGGMGMMPNAGPGVDGSNMGMWSDPNMGGWLGDDHGARAGESSYGEEAASEHQYDEGSQERGGPWPNTTKEKDRGSERDRSGSPDRRYRDDRGQGYDRDMPREREMERDHEYVDRRQRDARDVRRDRDKERSRDRERSLDHDRDRERDRDARDRRGDQRKYRNRDAEYDDERDRGRSSRTYSKSRHEERRSRSRDADYGKRRRMTSD